MAVIEDVPGLQVTINVSLGEPLAEYVDQEDEQGSKVTNVYIESRPGLKFEIAMQIDKRFAYRHEDIYCLTLIDGRPLCSMSSGSAGDCPEPRTWYNHIVYHNRNGDLIESEFEFGNRKLGMASDPGRYGHLITFEQRTTLTMTTWTPRILAT